MWLYIYVFNTTWFSDIRGHHFHAHSFEAGGVCDFQPKAFSINFTATNISCGSVNLRQRLMFTNIFVSGERKL